MVLKYQVPEAVKYLSVSLQFTKDITERSLCYIPIQPNAKTSIYESLDHDFTGENSPTAYPAVTAEQL